MTVGRGQRAHGEGTVYKRKDRPGWVAELPQVRGKRKRIYARTRDEAARKLRRALADRDRGLADADDRIKVGDFLTRWLEEDARPSIRPATYRSYERLVRLHLVPELGKVRLARLRPDDVQAMMNRKLAAGQSPGNVAKMRVVLRRALHVAMRWELVNRNVAALTAPPKVERYQARPFTQAEVRAFLRATSEDSLAALYVLAVTTGLRRGELLGLRWQDVDLEAGTVHIRYQLQRVNRELVLVQPKTGSSRRTAGLPEVAVAALRSHRAQQLQNRLLLGDTWRGSPLGDFVFTTDLGTPVDGDNLSKRYRKALAAAGLEHRRFHELRVGFGTMLQAAGHDLKTISDLMGHSSVKLTADTYVRVLDAQRRRAAADLDALLADPGVTADVTANGSAEPPSDEKVGEA